MPRDTNHKEQSPKALAGLASTPPRLHPSGPRVNVVECDSCGLHLPRSASAADVLAHPCYRGFTITLNAAGQINLA